MKILYIANVRLPTEKAHGVQIMKTCEAFAGAGHEVELVVSDRRTPIGADPFVYYGIRLRFPLTRVRVPDTVRFGRLGYWLETFVFARRALRLLRTRAPDVVYGRDEIVLAYLAARTKTRVVWETHTGARNRFARSLLSRGARVVAISQGLKELCVRLGARAERVLVSPDGVSVDDFAHSEPKERARARLGLPLEKRIAMYVGRLDGWKGSATFLEAAALLPQDVVAVVIGGETEQVEELAAAYPRVRFVGYRPYTELPDNQAAADCLVLPNTARDEISVRFTSPLKLFTYMASGVPMVVSDLPSIREIVSEREAYFFTPDDPRSLADSITQALTDENAAVRTRAAKAKARQYDWNARARMIAAFLERS